MSQRSPSAFAHGTSGLCCNTNRKLQPLGNASPLLNKKNTPIKNPKASANQPQGRKGGTDHASPLVQRYCRAKAVPGHQHTVLCVPTSCPRDPKMDKDPIKTPTHAPNGHAPSAREKGVSSRHLPNHGASFRVGFAAHSSLESLYRVRAGSKSGRETPTPMECNTHTLK